MRYAFVAFAIFIVFAPRTTTADAPPTTPPAWETAKTIDLDGVKVSISRPVLVARSSSRLWFPVILQPDNGKIMAIMSGEADTASAPPGKKVSWSTDGGLTWTPPRAEPAIHGGGAVRLPNGNTVIQSFSLTAHADGILSGITAAIDPDKREFHQLDQGMTVADWPRPMLAHADGERAGFVFNRHVLRAESGSYLGTIYGKFKETKRLALVAAESSDGAHWKVTGVIADDACDLKGNEGPNEAALAQLKDGRLTCIFRMGFQNTPYGQSFSDDAGKTWSKPLAMDGIFAVCPCIVQLPEHTLVLTGGRPGIFAWLNLPGDGKTWQQIDLQAIHNACEAADPITPGHTTAYTHTVAVDKNNILCIYDRIPFGWGTIPKTSTETNSVWVVRLTVSRSQ